jgi:hypothetical protein
MGGGPASEQRPSGTARGARFDTDLAPILDARRGWSRAAPR